jgi:hypothetical protein
MSVFRKINTKIKDAKCLESGLKKLGYSPVSSTEKQIVRGHGREKLSAEVVLRMEDTKLKGDIGFNKQEDGTYNMVYDSYVVKINQNDFLGKVVDEYAKAKVKKQMLAYPGFKLTEQKLNDGTIKMVFQEA